MQPKEIRITGVFKDGITPHIQRINKQINQLNQSVMALSGGRAKRRSFAFFGEAAMEMAKMKSALDGTTDSLREYRRQALAVARANRRMAGVSPAPTPSTNRQSPPSHTEGGGGNTAPPSMFDLTKATAIGNLVSSSITWAFSKGADIVRSTLMKVFAGFNERIEDQMSDIQSAGGIFALAQRKGLKDFGDNFDSALRFQKDLNSELAKAAGALPGSTGQYVQTAKGLTDGMMTTIGKDAENFKAVFGEGSEDMKDAMKNALTQLTTKGTLLGMGQQGGIPLPVLLERVLSQEKVNVQSMASTFAALEQNPLLKGALEEAEADINAAGANTAKRLQVVLKALDAALPAEQINAMKRSTSGLMEAFNSFFNDPESGLFGLGRTLNFEIAEFSSSSGMATGKKTTSGLFDMMNEIFANIALVISEMIPVLMDVFDPLSQIGELFVDLREQSYGIFQLFNQSTKYFQGVASKFDIDPGQFQVGIRSSLMAMLLWLENMGAVIDGAEGIKNTLKGSKELTSQFKGDTFKKLMSSFISSDFMVRLGENIGKAIALVVVNIDKAMRGISDAAGGASNPLGAAFAGFRDAGGGAAFRNILMTILSSVFNMVKDQIILIIKDNPVGSLIAGGTAYAAMNPGVVAQMGGKILEKAGQPLMTLGVNLFSKLALLMGGPVVWGILGAVVLTVLAVTMGDSIKKFFTNLANIFSDWATTQTGLWGVFIRSIAAVFQGLVKSINGLLDFLRGVVDFLVGLLTGDWAKMWDGVKEMLSGFSDIFLGIWEGVLNSILGTFRWVGEKMGILNRRARNDTQASISRLSSNTSSPGVSSSSPGGSFNVSALGQSADVGGMKVKPVSSVVSTAGKLMNIPKEALAGQGSMNLSTMLPLMESLGQKFDPNNKNAGKVQGEFQTWSGRHSQNSNHYKFRGIDIGDATTSPGTLGKMFWWLKNTFGASGEGGQLEELFYDPIGSMISGGTFKKGSIGGHGHHLHIGWKSGAELPSSITSAASSMYNGYTSPLMEEARNMPQGSRLAVANTSEAVLNRDQMRGMFEGLSSGSGGGIHIGNITVSGGNPKELASQVLDEIERAVVQSKIASAFL